MNKIPKLNCLRLLPELLAQNCNVRLGPISHIGRIVERNRQFAIQLIAVDQRTVTYVTFELVELTLLSIGQVIEELRRTLPSCYSA